MTADAALLVVILAVIPVDGVDRAAVAQSLRAAARDARCVSATVETEIDDTATVQVIRLRCRELAPLRRAPASP